VVLALVELDVVEFLVEMAQLSVDAGAHIALLPQFGQFGLNSPLRRAPAGP